jgi:RNA polymerase-binding protein DksA
MTTPISTPRRGVDQPHPDTLAERRASLLAELAAYREQLAEHQATVDQLASQTDSDSLAERELAVRAAARAADVVAAIEHALSRLDDGTYGTCERCGEPIAPARLEAIPHARYCVSCSAAAPTGLG